MAVSRWPPERGRRLKAGDGDEGRMLGEAGVRGACGGPWDDDRRKVK